MSDHSLRAWVSLCSALLLAMGGCSSGDDSDDAQGAGGSSGDGTSVSGGGRTGGSGGSSTYVPPTCDQGCQDYLVAWALNDTIWFAWNQQIAGHPSGAQDKTANCPLGGSVHFTGTTSVAENGFDTVDLVFDFAACENSEESFELVFTGTVTMQGTFQATTAFGALSFRTSDLQTTGTLHYYDDPVIEDTCETVMAQEGTGEAFTLTGRRCGRAFSESDLEANTGSGGTGGVGSGGSGAGGNTGAGGSACTCYCPDGSDCTGSTEPNPCGVDADGIPEVCGCPVDCP